MNITLKGPTQLTLKPETIALIVEFISKNVPYAVAKPILEDEIFPQLQSQVEDAPI